MRRSNPNPVLLTSKSFTSSGAGVPCYAFSFENQRVIKSCYTRYNVALRFLLSFSKGYDAVLQNRRSRAYMCACADVRAYMRAPVCVCSCYIATSKIKSLKRNGKSVAGWCSRCVVWPCYTEKNKILGINAAEFSAVANGGRDGLTEGGSDALTGGSDHLAGGSDGRNGAGCSGRNAVAGHSEKWRISAVFGAPFGGMFNAPMFNVCGKWRFPAVFRAVRTFFLKMFTGAETVPGGSPQNGRIDRRYIRSGFFFRFPDRISF